MAPGTDTTEIAWAKPSPQALGASGTALWPPHPAAPFDGSYLLPCTSKGPCQDVEAEFEATEKRLFAEAMRNICARTPARCPACRSRAVVPLILGYPMAPAVDAAERGEVVLGGCMVGYPGGDPEWACADCGHWWRSRGRRSEPGMEVPGG